MTNVEVKVLPQLRMAGVGVVIKNPYIEELMQALTKYKSACSNGKHGRSLTSRGCSGNGSTSSSQQR